MLTDHQIEDLSNRMDIPYGGCYFKDELPEKLSFNRTYFVNLQNSEDYEGNGNEGTHWTMVQCNKYPNGKMAAFFFDPYGAEPSINIKRVVENTTGIKGLPHNTKDIQSLMNNACGFFCLALAHYINAYKKRTGDLYSDCDNFIDMFDDLNKSIDFKKNEYILLHFFQAEDPNRRIPIDNLKRIIGEDEKGQIDPFKKAGYEKMPVDIKIMKDERE